MYLQACDLYIRHHKKNPGLDTIQPVKARNYIYYNLLQSITINHTESVGALLSGLEHYGTAQW